MSNGQGFIGNGDSGSLAVDAATAQPVALMFAGDANDAIGNPVADVLAALKATTTGTPTFTFVGGAQHAVAGCSLPGLSSVTVTPQSAKATGGACEMRQRRDHAQRSANLKYPGRDGLQRRESLDSPKEPAIMIFAAPGTTHAGIPPEIDGVRTRIIEMAIHVRARRIDPATSRAASSRISAAQATAVPASAIESARQIKEKHVAELMSDPAVQWRGCRRQLRQPRRSRDGIFVLKNKPHQPIPTTIDGVRTRIKETTGFRAIVDHSPRRSRLLRATSAPRISPRSPAGYLPSDGTGRNSDRMQH